MIQFDYLIFIRWVVQPPTNQQNSRKQRKNHDLLGFIGKTRYLFIIKSVGFKSGGFKGDISRWHVQTHFGGWEGFPLNKYRQEKETRKSGGGLWWFYIGKDKLHFNLTKTQHFFESELGTLHGTITYPIFTGKAGKSSTQNCWLVGRGYVIVPSKVPPKILNLYPVDFSSQSFVVNLVPTLKTLERVARSTKSTDLVWQHDMTKPSSSNRFLFAAGLCQKTLDPILWDQCWERGIQQNYPHIHTMSKNIVLSSSLRMSSQVNLCAAEWPGRQTQTLYLDAWQQNEVLLSWKEQGI